MSDQQSLNEIQNHIKNLSEIFNNILNRQKSIEFNDNVNNSMIFLRNSAAFNIGDDNFRRSFFQIICDEKFSFIETIQLIFEQKFDNFTAKIVSNDNTDDDSLMFILRSIQFFYNILNLQPNESEFRNLSKFYSFILNKKFYKFLNFYKIEPNQYFTNHQDLLKKITLVYTALLFRSFSNDSIRFERILNNEILPDTNNFWNPLFDHVEIELSEWSLWIFFLALKHEEFAKNLYCIISSKRRMILLDICMEFVDDECKKQKEISTIKNIEPDDCINLYDCQLCPLPVEFVKFINQLFHHQIREYFNKSNFDSNSEDLIVFSKISSFLLKMIAFQSYENILKKNDDYFKNLLDILSCFHSMSNDPKSIFFTQDLRSTNNNNKCFAENESVFGFKRNIIGLIANYLHENLEAQEQLRISGRFIALLDSAKIDRNNPFILQWTIFAIRNALKNNPANQQFIENLQKQGEIFDDKIFKDKIKFI